MMRISSERELLETFRLMDRDAVELPQGLSFPWVLKDYIAWSEPSGAKVYLVVLDRERRVPFGIVFRRDQAGGDAARMCDWCHAVRSGDGVSMLTAAASANRRVGVCACRDLSCKEKAGSAPGAHDVFESLSERERRRRITQRMLVFARQNLF